MSSFNGILVVKLSLLWFGKWQRAFLKSTLLFSILLIIVTISLKKISYHNFIRRLKVGKWLLILSARERRLTKYIFLLWVTHNLQPSLLNEMTFTGYLVNSTWIMLGLQGVKWMTLVWHDISCEISVTFIFSFRFHWVKNAISIEHWIGDSEN